jgi:HEAT repeat protein/sRNA-binding regulator protein Hfq
MSIGNICLQTVIILTLMSTVWPLEIKLSNGAVFTGEFVSQNENFVIIKTNGANVSIGKKMIAGISGMPEGVTVILPGSAIPQPPNPPSSSERQQSVPAEKADLFSVLSGMDLEITMKNGSLFQGTVINQDDLLINLQTGTGARVNIYKHVILKIKNRTTGSVMEGQIERQPVASKTATAPAQAVVPEPSVQRPTEPAPLPNAPPGAADSIGVDLSKPAEQSVQPQVTKTQAVAPAPPASLSPPPAAPPPVVTVTIPPVLPAPVAVPSAPAAVMPKKRGDGKRELLLKNGTSFIGVIVSENDRVLLFSTSGGTTITVIKRLIKEIDGVPYVLSPGAVPNPADTSLNLLRSQTSASVSPVNLPPAKSPDTQLTDSHTLMPRVEAAPGISAAALADSLKSSSTVTRSSAARQLGGMGQWATGAVPRLVALLGDTTGAADLPPLENDSLSMQKLMAPGYEAARSLARMGSAGCDELLRSVHAASSLVRQRALFGIGCLQDPAFLSPLKEALKDAEPTVRVCAVWGMRIPEGVDALISAIGDRDGDVRTYAVSGLADIALSQSTDVLMTALKDVRPQVRMYAALGLGRTKAQSAVPLLVTALNDVSPDVRYEAATALGAIADTAAFNPLAALLKDKQTRVRKAAFSALGEILDPRAIPLLYTSIQEHGDTLRPVIEKVLNQHTDIPRLITALDRPNPLVRENAAYLLWLLTGKDLGQDKTAWTKWSAEGGAAPGKKSGKSVTEKTGASEKEKKNKKSR